MGALSQLVDPAQTEAIARALEYLAARCDGTKSLVELVGGLVERMGVEGLDVLVGAGQHPGHLALPRAHEIHAAVNRYRRLRLAQS